MRKNDMRTALKALARFLRIYGYWPLVAELATEMEVRRNHLVDVLIYLQREGLISRLHVRSGHARHQLTARGWDVLGVEEMEPWRRPPTKSQIDRITSRVAAGLMRQGNTE